MNSVRALTLLAVALMLSGCATGADRLGAVRAGMSEAQVMATLGRPYTATVSGTRRTLLYRLADRAFLRGRYDFPGQYAVVLMNGRVVETGRNDAVVRQQIDLRVR